MENNKSPELPSFLFTLRGLREEQLKRSAIARKENDRYNQELRQTIDKYRPYTTAAQRRLWPMRARVKYAALATLKRTLMQLLKVVKR